MHRVKAPTANANYRAKKRAARAALGGFDKWCLVFKRRKQQLQILRIHWLDTSTYLSGKPSGVKDHACKKRGASCKNLKKGADKCLKLKEK